MNLGKFSLSVATTSARKSSGSSIPTLCACGGAKVTNKFKLNEAATELLLVKPADYVILLSNKKEVLAAIQNNDADLVAWAEENNTTIENYPISWAVAKGYPEFDKSGNPLKAKEPMTDALEEALRADGMVDEDGKVIAPVVDRFKGARLASTNKAGGIGSICDFADGSVWGEIRNNVGADKHVNFTIGKTAIEVPVFDGFKEVVIKAFPLEFAALETISARSKTATGASQTVGNEEVEDSEEAED